MLASIIFGFIKLWQPGSVELGLQFPLPLGVSLYPDRVPYGVLDVLGPAASGPRL